MSYLDTLHRIPDDIILAIAAQDFYEGDPARCICGWALRESMARELNVDVSHPRVVAVAYYSEFECHARFGGAQQEWSALWSGVCLDTSKVERAFVDRLNEIVK